MDQNHRYLGVLKLLGESSAYVHEELRGRILEALMDAMDDYPLKIIREGNYISVTLST